MRAYVRTYGLPAIITRASNNYGPYQFPEKVIPLFLTNALEGRELPVYGDGQHVREWLFVEDHCEGLLRVLQDGQIGEVYNIGGGQECTNVELARLIVQAVGVSEARIQFVSDRPAHDRRYALSSEKMAMAGIDPPLSQFFPKRRGGSRRYDRSNTMVQVFP